MSKEQTALERIKDELCKRKHACNYSNLPTSFKVMLADDIAKAYARECCQATQKKIADMDWDEWSYPKVTLKESIMDPDNIVIL